MQVMKLRALLYLKSLQCTLLMQNHSHAKLLPCRWLHHLNYVPSTANSYNREPGGNYTSGVWLYICVYWFRAVEWKSVCMVFFTPNRTECTLEEGPQYLQLIFKCPHKAAKFYVALQSCKPLQLSIQFGNSNLQQAADESSSYASWWSTSASSTTQYSFTRSTRTKDRQTVTILQLSLPSKAHKNHPEWTSSQLKKRRSDGVSFGSSHDELLYKYIYNTHTLRRQQIEWEGYYPSLESKPTAPQKRSATFC